MKLFSRKQLSQHDSDMTTGNIWSHLIRFSIPLLLGNIFQQLYNMVDTWVVGNFVSDIAFSAVGTVGPITNMLIGFFMGLSTGAGVVISQYYGAKREEKVSQTVHTSLLTTLILGIIMTVGGILAVPLMLDWIDMPAEVIPDATTYLTIYIAGILGLMIYNMGSGILRAVGDSKRPFYYLVVSAVLNTVLDLVFVLSFGMGVEGVAYATIIAQAVSAVLIMISLARNKSCVQFRFKKLRIHWQVLGKIFRVGLPAALQMTITSFSNIFVQSYINFFGKECMGGWTAYSKVDQLLLLPMQSLALAATTFVGQNLGMNQLERARDGTRKALILAMGSTVLLTIPVVIFAPYLVRFFNDNADIQVYGTQFLQTVTPFYVLCCFNQIYSGSLRGAGDSRATMIIMLLSFVGFRQLYLWLMANYISNTVFLISMAYPAGWLVCSIITLVYYRKVGLKKNRLLDASEMGAQ